MKKARLKYSFNLCGALQKAGMILEIIPAQDERVQNVWPGIQEKVGSKAVAVQFPHLNFPTFVHIDQIEIIDEE